MWDGSFWVNWRISFFFSKRFYLFIFTERGKEGETMMCGCCGWLSHTPHWGPSLQPRHVSRLRIELVPLCFSGWSSIHWRHKPGQKSLFKCWEVWQQIVFRKLKNIFLKTQILYWQRRLSVYLEVTGSVTSYILEKNFCQMSKSVFKNKQQKNRR